MYSALVFANDDPVDDGLLETREIMKMHLNASIAILAACDTGRGETGSGEGVIGLSWAFLLAGCPTTLVTQRKANSRATAELMMAFHRGLRSGATNAQALRRAQRAMIRSVRDRHPFYWAPFVLVGMPF